MNTQNRIPFDPNVPPERYVIKNFPPIVGQFDSSLQMDMEDFANAVSIPQRTLYGVHVDYKRFMDNIREERAKREEELKKKRSANIGKFGYDEQGRQTTPSKCPSAFGLKFLGRVNIFGSYFDFFFEQSSGQTLSSRNKSKWSSFKRWTKGSTVESILDNLIEIEKLRISKSKELSTFNRNFDVATAQFAHGIDNDLMDSLNSKSEW